MNLLPIDDRVIIKPNEPTSKTSGGVYLPEGAQPEATSGVVVAVGPGLKIVGVQTENQRFEMSVSIGDSVYYPKFSAYKFEYNGDEYVIIKETELFAVEKKSKDFIVDKEKIKSALLETVIDTTEEKEEIVELRETILDMLRKINEKLGDTNEK